MPDTVSGHVPFLLAVFVFKEGFDSERLFTFGLVWVGLVLFAADSVRRARKRLG